MSKKHILKYSPEVRERVVRTLMEHGTEHASQWAAIVSIAAKFGCIAQTRHNWVAQANRDAGARAVLEVASVTGFDRSIPF